MRSLPSVPTIVYKDNYFVPGRDFQNAEHAVNIINNFERSEHETQKQLLESIKTLNYQINMAFGNLDGVLKQIENKLNKKDEHKSTN